MTIVKKNSIRLPLNDRAGLKVKVYDDKMQSPPRYGETIGVTENNVLLLEERPEYEKLPLHHFNYILDTGDVAFIND